MGEEIDAFRRRYGSERRIHQCAPAGIMQLRAASLIFTKSPPIGTQPQASGHFCGRGAYLEEMKPQPFNEAACSAACHGSHSTAPWGSQSRA
ncbi:hypothetical protein NDU88_002947 [Pleurodeles waltl]|uniref:Uncharacterized protein n=1 Tax=Pleurodeles waltl TaxID=8319 RepID=A0AAV7W4M2_PLEWA|nr:hypothetical protein NDU88_002947 [Pleurodeles waltl]